ncbi:MAG: flagellar motor stator protein MotA [Desulfobacteraceae bacterium]|nr:flagellar motor stator protein MotA [Desulfobacteraceae bacterium]
MFVVIGALIVLGGVLGGFTIAGGSVLLLMHVSEFIIIGSCMIGTLLISAPTKLLFKVITKTMAILSGKTVTKKVYLELLKLLHELFVVIRKDGLMSLESHIESPEDSDIFNKYPLVAKDHHLLLFIADSLRLISLNEVPSHDLEMLMDMDIELHHHEGTKPGMLLQKMGDSLPGIGIVACVLGIMITMQAISGPPEQIGEKVAAALVGTFLGIFMSYGFITPLSVKMEMINDDESRLYSVIKSGITSVAKGFSPLVSAEFARRNISNDFRPSFLEMENFLKGKA